MSEAEQQDVNHEVEILDDKSKEGESKGTKRKLTSDVWLDSEKFKVAGVEKAKCKHCKKLLSGNSRSGTIHLRNHLERCPLKNRKGHSQLQLQARNETGKTKINNFKFDQKRSRLDLARMVIKHNYPFNMVEHELFAIFLSNLQPEFTLHSRNTLRADTLKVYEMEKEKLYKYLDSLPSRISLTTDLWTCGTQNVAYCCLTCHFIDDEWVLRKKILAFPMVDTDHDGESLCEMIRGLLLEWNIKKKVCSLTVDNAAANDVMTRELKKWLNTRELLSLNGELFHNRCAAHVTNLIVQDGLKAIDGVLKKIRDSVLYVKASPQRKQKFENVLKQSKLRDRKRPSEDMPVRWNSTFHMLESALEIKEAFYRLSEVDKHYTSNPTKKEWADGEDVCKRLKVFYDATCKFSGVKYPNANIYFPIVCGIQKTIMKWKDHNEPLVQMMAEAMKEKFNKYWSECSTLMGVAIVLDPRFKLDLVEFNLNEIYGIGAESQLQKIRTALSTLYNEYGGKPASKNSSSHVLAASDVSSSSTNLSEVGMDNLVDFNQWYDKTRNANIIASMKSELERYLDEPIVREKEFDILSWWKDNSPRFPIMAKLARDILAVPISTVASESAFSIGGNIVEPSRHALGVDIVQALMCGQDWIGTLEEKVSRRSKKASTLKSKT